MFDTNKATVANQAELTDERFENASGGADYVHIGNIKSQSLLRKTGAGSFLKRGNTEDELALKQSGSAGKAPIHDLTMKKYVD